MIKTGDIDLSDLVPAETGLDAWDVEITLSTGEIVTLPPMVARMRKAAKERQEEARIRYCAKHHKDPATFTGCPSCGNTGKAYANDLPCYCAHSRTMLKFIAANEAADTERLAEIVRAERRRS